MATSKYRGVSKDGNRWRCLLQFQGKRENLGIFKTEEEAARAYDKRAREIGNLPLNFPDEQRQAEDVRLVRCDQIRTDLGTQSRAEMYAGTVSEYVEALRRRKKLPPVRVVWDGAQFVLWSGFHRLAAYRAEGIERIPCVVTEGTVRDARRLSAGANAAHGRPRSPEDKAAAVRLLLRDAEWGQLSSNALADMADVSTHLVERVRNEGREAGAPPAETTRVGRDGRARKTGKPIANGKAFDLKAHSAMFGCLLRQVDRLGELYGAKHTPEADGLRRTIREWQDRFTGWYHQLSKSRPQGD